MEAGAQALKQERLAKKKLQALQKSRVGTWFEAILKFLGVDKLNKYQRALLAFVLYAAMWPNALPLRLLRDKFVRQLVVVRDTFISNVAANLVGLTSTGLIISMGSQRTGGNGGNSDGGNSDEGGAAPTPDEPNAPTARDVTTSGSISEGDSRSTTPSSRSVTPLSPIQESSAEVVVNSGASRTSDADLAIDDKYSTDASGVDSQWQSRVKPTESDAVSLKEIPSSNNNDDNTNNDEAMDNSSVIKQKTVLTLSFPKLTSKAGKYVHTKFNHSGDCALTNNLLTGVPKNAISL